MNLNHIVEDLHALAVRVDSLQFMDNNPRVHDDRSFDAICRSVKKFKQTKPIVLANDGRTVLAGNGTLEVARRMGWEFIAASKSELDAGSAEAMAYAIADNRTTDLSYFDQTIIDDAMRAFDDTLRDASGFIDSIFEVEGGNEVQTPHGASEGVSANNSDSGPETRTQGITQEADLPEIVRSAETSDPEFEANADSGSSAETTAPAVRVASIRYDLVFEDDSDQQEFFEFTRWLRAKYPDIPTVGGRIVEWLRTEAPAWG